MNDEIFDWLEGLYVTYMDGGKYLEGLMREANALRLQYIGELMETRLEQLKREKSNE